MHDFWNQIIFSNPLKRYIIIASTILFVIILKRFISRLIAMLIFRLIRKMGPGTDKSAFGDLVVGPIGNFLVVLVSVSSIEKLHFPAELEFDIYEVTSRQIAHSIA